MQKTAQAQREQIDRLLKQNAKFMERAVEIKAVMGIDDSTATKLGFEAVRDAELAFEVDVGSVEKTNFTDSPKLALSQSPLSNPKQIFFFVLDMHQL